MKNLLLIYFLFLSLCSNAQMFNDTTFDSKVIRPAYKKNKGPRILIDAGHNNFIAKWGLIQPFVDLSTSDGYKPMIDSLPFTKNYLSKFDIILITPALPFVFGTKKEVGNLITFTKDEMDQLHTWVSEGGSLIMLSEHPPIDEAMMPLLNKFGISSSIGMASDSLHYDTSYGLTYVVQHTKENGSLSAKHPVLDGNTSGEKINALATFGGSSIKGDGYVNILPLSPTATVRKWVGLGPLNQGNSQGLVGPVGKGKLIALSDCNGFTSMYMGKEKKVYAGMQVKPYDWKQFVLNSLHWLSK